MMATILFLIATILTLWLVYPLASGAVGNRETSGIWPRIGLTVVVLLTWVAAKGVAYLHMVHH